VLIMKPPSWMPPPVIHSLLSEMPKYRTFDPSGFVPFPVSRGSDGNFGKGMEMASQKRQTKESNTALYDTIQLNAGIFGYNGKVTCLSK